MKQRQKDQQATPIAAPTANEPEKPKTAADLAAQLQALASEKAEIDAYIEASEQYEAEHILDASDDELDRVAADVARLRRRAKRLDLATDILTKQLKVATTEESEAVRLERYRAAEILCAEAEMLISVTYAQHAAAIRDCLVRLGEIKAQIGTVNDDLPEGSPHLNPENFRTMPATPGTVTFRPEAYYVDDAGDEVKPSAARPLSQDASGQYWIDLPHGEDEPVQRQRVVARTRDVRVPSPGRPAVSPEPLATMVRLPRVKYEDPDFWWARSAAWPA